MPFNYENFINNSKSEYTKEIIGIDDFLKSLDFHYFSDVKLNNKHITFNSISLVLEISCNLDLLELLAHFNTDRWGYNGKEKSPLEQALEILDLQNKYHIDIEELTFFLNDTSVVIKRIYDRSIATQLNDILKQIAFNYVFLTRGLTQKPYEIFVPIFEDTIQHMDDNEEELNIAPKSYSEFWGIYLDKDDEASIYDVNKNTYVSGDLEFLSE
ncbi:hypothetical protein [Maribacter litoralis]|uniref:Uncharacterized protein n=1 Tax=Maribacter litoralis TaxID=2059726 RepID=A0A653XMR3_9FLAO|nr:hypothetical protein [Maribacter litoralis]VXC31337.1 conserved hypothetical protein [Maribacter litoralis]